MINAGIRSRSADRHVMSLRPNRLILNTALGCTITRSTAHNNSNCIFLQKVLYNHDLYVIAAAASVSWRLNRRVSRIFFFGRRLIRRLTGLAASDQVRVVGVTLTSDLCLHKHVASVCATCLYWLRQLMRVNVHLTLS